MSQEETLSLQDRYAPRNYCFGCGPANEKGLRIKSFPGDDGELVCRWQPQRDHRAFGDVLNGGIIGTLFDCHSNWAAACHLMREGGLEKPPCTVTVDSTTTSRISPQIGTAADTDWIAVTLTAGAEYQIDVKGDVSADPGGTLPDPRMWMRDAGGTRISGQSDDNGGDGANARLTFTPTATGTHYIEVRSRYAAEDGTYTVGVELLTGPRESPSLEEAYQRCVRLAREHYENFSVGTWLLPKTVLPHVCAVYAFCRTVDDLGDEAEGDRLHLLDLWQEDLERCYTGMPRHTYLVALQHTA